MSFREEFGFGLAVFAIFMLIGLLMVSSMVTASYLSCMGFASTGYEVKYSWGCYAKVDGKWVPSRYVFGDANEVRIQSKKP